MGNVDVEQKRLMRARFIHALYDLTDGNTIAYASAAEVAEGLGLDESERFAVVQYLEDRDLIEVRDAGGNVIDLTARGVDEVEQARSRPETPTANIRTSYNVVIHGDVSGVMNVGGSNISQSQQITLSSEQTQQIATWIADFRSSLSEIADPDDADEAAAVLDRAEKELRRGEPSIERLKRFVTTLTSIGAGVGALSRIIEQAQQLPIW